jgi:hypothetical protein
MGMRRVERPPAGFDNPADTIETLNVSPLPEQLLRLQ